MNKGKFLLLLVWLLTAARANAELEWISKATAGHPTGRMSHSGPRISGDGRFVVYESRDVSIPLHRTRFREITLFDREKQSFRIIESLDSERSNSRPSLSDSGRYVAYQSHPLSALRGEPPMVGEFFVFDRIANQSVSQTFGYRREALDGENLDASFSRDGDYLVFTSNAPLYPGLKNGITRAVYIYEIRRRRLQLVSQSLNGVPANRPSGDPRVSRNGRYVAFKSAATNLVRLLPLESLSTHLYLLDRRSRELIQISDDQRGFDTSQWAVGRYDMDHHAVRLVFEGRRRLDREPTGILTTTDLFVFEKSSGAVAQLTDGIFLGRSHSPTLSGDGRYLAFIFRGIETKSESIEGGLVVYDMSTHTWSLIVEGSCSNPRISGDGRFIVFESDQKDIVPGAPGQLSNIFLVRNRLKD